MRMGKSSRKSLFISSSESYSGKSAFCLGLGSILMDMGYKIGYMKPVGNLLTEEDGILTDADVIHARQVLGIEDPAELMSPALMTHELINNTLSGKKHNLVSKITSAYKKISKSRDLMLLEGAGDVGGGLMLGLSDPDVAKILKSDILLLTRYDCLYAIDRILNDVRFIREKTKSIGVIFNNVPASDLKTVNTIVRSFLQEKGIQTVGIIPQDDVLQSVSLSDLKSRLNAKDIVEGDALIGSFVVGAMSQEHAIKYFRRVSDKAVITGGDRSDILLAALETPTRCLILTGNLVPDEKVIAKARQKNVPVVMTSYDTATTVQISESMINRLSVTQDLKLARIKELILKNVDIDTLL